MRIFRSSTYDQLPGELKAMVSPTGGPWMALMGTVGDIAEWCDRRMSKGHQIIAATGETRSPMVKAAFEQIGLDKLLAGGGESPENLMLEGKQLTSYFHVPTAPGSQYIPAQDFVARYQIQSVVGVGSPFISGAVYLALAFSKAPIDDASAREFAEVAPFLSSLLAIHDGRRVLWS
jgi:hypothetical protein